MKAVIAVLVAALAITGYVAYRSVFVQPDLQDTNPMSDEKRIELGDYVLVPSSVSKERVTKTGLPGASEDMRHLLTVPKLESKPFDRFERDDYRPSDSEWVLDIEFEGGPVLKQTELAQRFGREWLQRSGTPTVYGWSPDTGHWTFLVSADVPSTFTKLCFGWRLIDPLEEDLEITADDLESFKKSAIEAAEKFGTPIARVNRPANEAAAFARRLKQFVAECQRDVIVVLAASKAKTYEGRQIWDVMSCLGLEWGDGDLFHWQNESGNGDDFFFSVETTTPPGYFFPEQIAAGKVQVGDLVFGYSLPRSAAPEAVFDSMMRAVRYAQQRLGGNILDRFGKPLDEELIRRQIQATLDRMKQEGFEPGSDESLYVF